MEDLIVCRCEGVRLSEIEAALHEEANSVPGVKKRVRPGMGFCQGRVCQPIIADILKNKTDTTIFQRAQAPVRPVKLGDILSNEGEME